MKYGLPETVTEQTLFDQAVVHLFTQGRQAKTTRGTCRYRADDGMACGVGCFISDDRYDKHIETRAARSEEVLSLMPELRPHVGLMQDIQSTHDGAEVSEDGTFDRLKLAVRLFRLARGRDLDTSVVDAQYGESVEAFA